VVQQIAEDWPARSLNSAPCTVTHISEIGFEHINYASVQLNMRATPIGWIRLAGEYALTHHHIDPSQSCRRRNRCRRAEATNAYPATLHMLHIEVKQHVPRRFAKLDVGKDAVSTAACGEQKSRERSEPLGRLGESAGSVGVHHAGTLRAFDDLHEALDLD
jgi:hypothetical protein